MIILTPHNWTLLCKINHEVNHAVTYRTDLDQYHKTEFWTHPRIPGSALRNTQEIDCWTGDSEAAALYKQMSYINLGWDYKALRLMTCVTKENFGHCFLSVDFYYSPKEGVPLPAEPEATYYLDLTDPPLTGVNIVHRGYHSFVRQKPGNWLWSGVEL